MRPATEKSATWRTSARVFFCAVPSATHMTEETATSTRRPKPKVSTTAMVGRQQRQAGRAAAGGFAASPSTGALVMISCVMADWPWLQIGRAPGREREWQYVWISGGRGA